MTSERLSTWMDGERDGAGAAPADDAARDACAVWWLIGDVMRREKAMSADLSARVMQALEAEPTVLAPRVPAQHAAANMPRWMPIAAAVAGVAVVAWATLGGRAEQGRTLEVATLASASSVQGLAGLSLAGTTPSREQEDTRAYLLAHQANVRGSQMAGVSGYVRPVSFDQGLVASR